MKKLDKEEGDDKDDRKRGYNSLKVLQLAVLWCPCPISHAARCAVPVMLDLAPETPFAARPCRPTKRMSRLRRWRLGA